MSSRQLRIHGRSALFGGVALLALSVGAAAKDLPATADGASRIASFFATYGGKAASSAPALTIKPEGSDYLVSIDVAALTTPLEAMGVHYDPATITFKAFEQDDGAWRIEQGDVPPMKVQSTKDGRTIESNFTMTGVKSVTVVDPALGFIRSGDASIDKMAIKAQGPGVDESIDAGPIQATMTGKADAGGALAAEVKETFGAFALTMAVDPRIANPKSIADAKPVNVAASAEGIGAGVKLGGIKMKTVLDLWAFLVAHQGRPALADNEAALKPLLLAALANPAAFDQTTEIKKLTVQAPQGAFVFEGAKIGVGGAASGPTSRFEEHFSATGVTLPDAIVPAMFHDLVPTSFDFGFKLTGFDLTAAGAEAVADMHLAGDGPAISKEDGDKVTAKLLGAGPLVIDIPPSHFVAPQLDIAFEGQIKYLPGGKPTGAITVHMRNFDNTVTALKGLGPDTERKMVPALAMAKGLAKTDPDGALSWVGEIGPDRVMKVNGLPLGKAPF